MNKSRCGDKGVTRNGKFVCTHALSNVCDSKVLPCSSDGGSTSSGGKGWERYHDSDMGQYFSGCLGAWGTLVTLTLPELVVEVIVQ